VAEPTFLDEAIEEVVDAVSYYELVAAPGTAQRLFLEAKVIVQRVLESPRRWPVEQNGFRRWRLENFASAFPGVVGMYQNCYYPARCSRSVKRSSRGGWRGG
jgi:hypothetical protein